MNPNKFIELVKKEFGIVMVNEEKVIRAVWGTATSRGLVGGIGEEASAEQILAKYDEINGYMVKGGYKVKNRSFFDAKSKKPIAPSKVILLVKVNGDYVEHEEGAPMSLEMQIAKEQKGKKSDKKSKREDKVVESYEK